MGQHPRPAPSPGQILGAGHQPPLTPPTGVLAPVDVHARRPSPGGRHFDGHPSTTCPRNRQVDAAREQGTLRSDVTALDVRILVGGYARVLSDLGIRDPEEWRRYAGMVMAALRP
ncbi:hypothetical protein FRAHR75_320036 [Frankia sp. Hr75.2]|nr:hypothetical protein FRAHR75_320036 [Frankia sp. Hr75.2]